MPEPTPSMLNTGARKGWLSAVARGLTLVAALAFLIRGVRWHEITGATKGAGAAWPVLMVGLNAVMMSLRALRLRALLGRRISFAACFAARLTSSALNNITPLRGGDVARLWMIARAGAVTKSTAAAISVVENLVELAVLAIVGFSASLLVAGQRWASVATPVVFCAAAGVLVVLRTTTSRAAGPSGPVSGNGGLARVGAKLKGFAARLETGFRAISQPGVLVSASLLSLLAWLCEIAMIVLGARSMNLAVSPALAAIVLVGVNLALALPSTPAGAGPFEGAVVAVLIFAGVGKSPAVAFALYYHAIQVIPVTVVGIAVLLLLKRSAAREADPASGS